ncbi:MAG TPA: hypothetical protein VGX23_20530 [Actinocrinis sp.]|nr:hypothetical protein [Actinocrinis sp.]
MSPPGAGRARVLPPLTLAVLIATLALLCAVAAMAEVAERGLEQPTIAAAFGLTIVAGESMRLTLPGGRDAAPLAATAGLGYALTIYAAGKPTTYSAAQVVAVTAVCTTLGTLAPALGGRPPQTGYLARRILVVGFAAALCRGLLLQHPLDWSVRMHRPHLEIAVLVLIAGGSVCVENVLVVLFNPPGPAGPLSGPATGVVRSRARAVVAECRTSIRICPAVVALAVAVALGANPLGVWALPIAVAPILVMQRSLRRYAAVRATYQQTIRALSRVTDLAGYTEPEHAQRVCRLSLAIGRELSLSEAALLDLEYAALLHDIGQLSLTDPIPGGATVLLEAEQAARIAALGADVVRQTRVLGRAADIIECQTFSYCPPSPAAAPGVDVIRLSGSIIRVANAYDDLVGGSNDPDRQLAAVNRIRVGLATEYDPKAVEALTRLIAARQPALSLG